MRLIHLTLNPQEAELLASVLRDWSGEYATEQEAESLAEMVKVLDRGLGR